MTVDVPRHSIDLSLFEGRAAEYSEHLARLLPLLETMPDKFVFACGTANSLLSVQSLADPQGLSRSTQEAALRNEQLAVGMFQVTDVGFAGQAATVSLRVLDTELTIPAKRNHAATQGSWREAFWWSRIARDDDASTLLSRFPVDRLRNTGDGSWSSEFTYQWVSILQDAWLAGLREQTGRVNSLATNEDVSGPEGQYRTDHLLRPPMDVFDALAAGDGERFDQALADALIEYRTFYDTARARTDPSGFVSVPLLALACWAHDLGLPVTVESDYIPKHFIENPDWVAELTATST
ncbi:immunity 49 family protein [Nocardia sp. BMG111209]|uniref:immunity 49 family protein n=1 Tax=Nocardia sp. BMG111209 TaxID=1160137 RepID=UPI00036CCDB4|nr:immunity 49 family protein [Nocardia sp. BMG111209]